MGKSASRFIFLWGLSVLFPFFPGSLRAEDADLDADADADVQEERPRKDDSHLKNTRKQITLNMVLEQGLRENPDERARQYQGLLTDVKQEGLFAGFWYPRVQLFVDMENQRVEKVRSNDNGSNSSKSGTGSLGLRLGDYTLFNWGKDYLEFASSKATLQREKETLFEQRRDLKHDLIALYFRFSLFRELERINRDHVGHATFIYRLNREKAPLRKITQQEYFQSRSLYLRAQKVYNQARIDAHEVEKEMSFSIGDPSPTLYLPLENLDYKRLNINLEQSLALARKHNPEINNRKVIFVNSVRNVEKVAKENLPLPKFSFNLGSYVHTFSKSSGNTSLDTSDPGPGGDNLEVRASVNVTWDILGENGFFNGRTRASAHYQKMIAEIGVDKAKGQMEVTIRQFLKTILELEQQMEIAKPLLTNAQKKFDHILDNYMKKKATFLVLQDALEDLRSSEENFLRTRYDHLAAKLELAKAIGVEDFPGENFEKLAVRED